MKKQNKQGVSLIVLVITIIVMIILASSVIISLSDTNIIEKSNKAVDETNFKEVQQLASLIWAEAYLDGTTIDKNYILGKLAEQGVDGNDYHIELTDTGVSVRKISLGDLITSAEDYGKPVYYVANGVSKWQVYYEDEVNKRVFLISTDSVESTKLDNGILVKDLTDKEKELYSMFQVGNGPKYTLVDEVTVNGIKSTMTGCQGVAKLIRNYSAYANKKDYGTYVIGAIGAPTIELLTAGWNSKGYEPIMRLTLGDKGYIINGESYLNITSDGLYMPEANYWLASVMNAQVSYAAIANSGLLSSGSVSAISAEIHPVVCLNSDIPAVVTDGGYSLLK